MSALGWFRRRSFGKCRFALLLVFAIGFGARSLVGMVGELHDLGHPDAVHGQPLATAAEAGENGALHVLLHHTYCCSHCAWMTGGETTLAIVPMVSGGLPVDVTRHIPESEITAPFRPPIRA